MVVRYVRNDFQKVPSSRNVHVVCFREKSSFPFATVTSWLFYNNVTLVQQALLHHNRYDHCWQDDYWLCCCKCQAYTRTTRFYLSSQNVHVFPLLLIFETFETVFRFNLTRLNLRLTVVTELLVTFLLFYLSG